MTYNLNFGGSMSCGSFVDKILANHKRYPRCLIDVHKGTIYQVRNRLEDHETEQRGCSFQNVA